MRNLIVYYSYEGNTEKIVEALGKAIKCDILKLEPIEEKKSKSLFRFIWGAKEVYMTKKPKLKPYNVDLSKYDNLIICSPCWFGSYAPPINTFISDNKIENKNIYLLMCDGGNLRNTFKNCEEALKGNKIISKIDFKYPIKNGIEKAQSEAIIWIKTYIKD